MESLGGRGRATGSSRIIRKEGLRIRQEETE